ncbi:transposase, partial [Algoriphagus namhaensis]
LSRESSRKTSTGFVQHLRHYQAKNCTGCPLAGSCKAGKDGKVLQVNRTLQNHKHKAKALLTSEEGIKKRKQRATDVEPVFGNLKYNKDMGRYRLRGKEKVEVETGLLLIAHNLAKRAN